MIKYKYAVMEAPRPPFTIVPHIELLESRRSVEDYLKQHPPGGGEPRVSVYRLVPMQIKSRRVPLPVAYETQYDITEYPR